MGLSLLEREETMPSDGQRRALTEPPILARRHIDDGVELDLLVTSELATLSGHFPGVPIVPGICLLDWAIRHARDHLAVLHDNAERLQVKFRRVLRPDCRVTLSLRRVSPGRVEFRYFDADTVYASGSLVTTDA
jgi:3-hydroxymyristoyl/3-hydroxydecanoyl-(acyl carrier protein) dehydratase